MDKKTALIISIATVIGFATGKIQEEYSSVAMAQTVASNPITLDSTDATKLEEVFSKIMGPDTVFGSLNCDRAVLIDEKTKEEKDSRICRAVGIRKVDIESLPKGKSSEVIPIP